MPEYYDMQGQERLKHVQDEPENPYEKLVPDQRLAVVPEFTLESGVVMRDVTVAYKTWGKLNDAGTNCIVICHALTGSADAADWWGPAFGSGKAFDPTRFFIVCLNSLGSPYGSASPVTLNPETGEHYGPEFPLTTVRDDVSLHKIVLDGLGVKQIAMCVGGSMGGMLVLEWAFFGDFVRSIVPIATSARHSAWCISWGEAQRQSIYSDPKYGDGYYSFADPPEFGLGAARMSALLTYRSRNSFESRFGRNVPDPAKQPYPNAPVPQTPTEEHWTIHTDGHLARGGARQRQSPGASSDRSATPPPDSSGASRAGAKPLAPTKFSAQGYLRYQAKKFVARFDANCYIAITRKLDTHDISRGRFDTLEEALASIQQPCLVLGIESDGLFTFAEQEQIATYVKHAELNRIISPEGHDGFLLEFDQVSKFIVDFQHKAIPEFMQPGAAISEDLDAGHQGHSVFGEVDDITTW